MNIGKPGPFQIIESEGHGDLDNPINAPRRRYDCINYETCLVIAAGLNWDSFTCRGCSGEYQDPLYWRARQEINKDSVVKKICELPDACMKNESMADPSAKSKNPGSVKGKNSSTVYDLTPRLKVVGK